MRAFNVRFALKPTEVLRCRELTRCATFRHSRQRCRAVRKRYSHINERPPRPLARPQYQQSAPCWDRKKPRLWWAGLRITRDIRGSQTLASAAGQFRARGLVPERKAPPKRGQVYCGRKGTLGLPQQSNSGGGGGWFLQRRALATRVTECCRRTTDVRCFQPFRGERGRRVRSRRPRDWFTNASVSSS
jgi:hypothetical protein